MWYTLNGFMGSANGAGVLPVDPGRLDDFRGYLDQLLAVSSFSSSRRRGQLLRYLVEHALAGQAAEVTEYGIALDVFGKPTSFDPRLEATVRVEMSRLRRALSDHYADAGAADPWHIELPARGYLLVITPNQAFPAAVAEAPAEIGESRAGKRVSRRWLWVAAAAIAAVVVLLARNGGKPQSPIRSIVVLPFQNLTGDVQKDYLADGVTEQLTDALAQNPSLRVVARTSAFQFKGEGVDIRQIGRQLSADGVIEGSLRSTGGRLFLTVQLDRSADGYHIFSRTFEGSSQELGEMESQIAPLVLSALRPRDTLRAHRTPDPQALDYYLRARAARGRAGAREQFERAVPLLEQAIARDPGYAEAYAELSATYAAAAVNIAPEPVAYAEKARAAATRALELDAQCATARAVFGFLKGMIFSQWKESEADLRDALRLQPQAVLFHNWLGLVLMAQGRFPDAIAELRAAENLDPLIAGPGVTTGLALYMARRYDAAIEQYTKVLEFHPDTTIVHAFLGAAWEMKRDYTRAMAEYQLALPSDPTTELRIIHLLAAEGHTAEARRSLRPIEHAEAGGFHAGAYDLAAIHAALGERDAAFSSLERAREQRDLRFLKVDPMLDPIRQDPRYFALLANAGFQEQ